MNPAGSILPIFAPAPGRTFFQSNLSVERFDGWGSIEPTETAAVFMDQLLPPTSHPRLTVLLQPMSLSKSAK
jgi:hypothetical protein